MDSIGIRVTKDREVGLRFDAFPDNIYEALSIEVNALATELLARVQAATPSLTGKLRSQERLRLFKDKNRISGYVDIAGTAGSQDFAKAAAIEYGAHKRTTVSAHSMKLDHAWDKMLSAPMDVIVGAYDRTPNIAESAYERGPLDEMGPEIIDRLNAVVEQAVAKANE
jgi:hypothetical protein